MADTTGQCSLLERDAHSQLSSRRQLTQAAAAAPAPRQQLPVCCDRRGVELGG